MSKRASKSEHLRRVDQVIQLITRGIDSSQIIRMLILELDICERTVQRYVAEAKEYLKATANQPTLEALGILKFRMEQAYTKCALANDVDRMHRNLDLQLKYLGEKSKLEETSDAKSSVPAISDTLAGLFEEVKKKS